MSKNTQWVAEIVDAGVKKSLCIVTGLVMGKAYAHRLIGSAKVKSVLSPIGDIHPANEAQVRPLTKLETPEAQQEAWETALGKTILPNDA